MTTVKTLKVEVQFRVLQEHTVKVQLQVHKATANLPVNNKILVLITEATHFGAESTAKEDKFAPKNQVQ